MGAPSEPKQAADDVRRYRRALEGLLGVPAAEGNTIEVLRNGDEIFPGLFEAIRSAETTIDFLTFVYWEGRVGKEVAEALAQRAPGRRAGARPARCLGHPHDGGLPQPTMLHAKVMTIDGTVANVGSANFNSRSLTLDDEANLVVFDSDLVATLDRHFDEDVERSEPVKVGQWDDRPVAQRAKEKVASMIDEHF